MPENPDDGLGEHVQRKLHSSFFWWHLRDHGHFLAFIFQGWSLTAQQRAFAKVLTSGQWKGQGTDQASELSIQEAMGCSGENVNAECICQLGKWLVEHLVCAETWRCAVVETVSAFSEQAFIPSAVYGALLCSVRGPGKRTCPQEACSLYRKVKWWCWIGSSVAEVSTERQLNSTGEAKVAFWRKWRGPELSFQGHVGIVGWSRWESVRSSSICRASEDREPGLCWTTLAAHIALALW